MIFKRKLQDLLASGAETLEQGRHSMGVRKDSSRFIRILASLFVVPLTSCASIAPSNHLAVLQPSTSISLCSLHDREGEFAEKVVTISAEFTAWREGGLLEDRACKDVLYDIVIPSKQAEADELTGAFRDEIQSPLMKVPTKYDLVFEAVYLPDGGKTALLPTDHGLLKIIRIVSYQKSADQ